MGALGARDAGGVPVTPAELEEVEAMTRARFVYAPERDASQRDHRVYRAVWWARDHGGPPILMSIRGYEEYVRDCVGDALERGAIDRCDILSAFRTAGVTLGLPVVKCEECCPPMDFSGVSLFGVPAGGLT
jgi:hypothetical protein